MVVKERVNVTTLGMNHYLNKFNTQHTTTVSVM